MKTLIIAHSDCIKKLNSNILKKIKEANLYEKTN